MTAAIAEAVKEKKAPPPSIGSSTPLHAMVQPAKYPTQDVPVYLIVRSETNRVPEVDDVFVESIRPGVNSPVLLRPIKAAKEHVEAHAASWQRIDTPPLVIGQTIYKLVFGERRWLAAQRAGHTHIPATIRDLSETEALKIQVKENEDREDYKPMERAAAYAHLRDQYMKDHAGEKGFTEEKCCALIAADLPNDKIKGRTVQQIIALGKLHKFCQDALNQGEMEASHGYELCRRSEEEQLELLKWLRQQTQHSQGDIPSVRRLKLEIRNMDIRAEDKRRQEKLFKDPQPGTATTRVPTVEEVAVANKLTEVEQRLEKKYGKAYYRLSTDPVAKPIRNNFIKAGGWKEVVKGTCKGIAGDDVSLAAVIIDGPRQAQVINACVGTGMLACKKHWTAPAQTSAPEFFRNDGKIGDAKLHGGAKPPTPAQIQKEAEAAAKRDREHKRQQDAFEREERIKKSYRGLFFAALAKKAQINSRLLTHVVPNMIFEVWENELPIEAFAQDVLGWPAPKDGHAYRYEEVKRYAAKHTRKFTGALLAAMVLTLYLNEGEAVKIAKYMGVDPKKLRQKATAAVKEDAKARLPKPPATQKEKQLHNALHVFAGAQKTWEKLRRTGASNTELLNAIREHMGNGGQSNEDGNVSYKGSIPAIWFNAMSAGNVKPSLQGAALVAAVRDLLKIPEKGDVDA